ncbi:hypothetical protein HPB52_001054 [Rhipicephalus sanguineus]|uniref:Homeobox domain-containing protein n=1 Tax=Rhipicephalus sanguineus TaxID=34632 RepID=A0A9D4T8C5_RHISA|nr:hypothetical protein HPB52_001054 [Rhipicephalus sanguineus]
MVRKQRRSRTAFNKQQLSALERTFAQIPYPDLYTRECLASATSLPEPRIQVRLSQCPLPFGIFLEPSVVSTLLVHATCNARLLTYAIKRAFLPPLVAQLKGPFPPSQGQGARICRLLRTETWRQIGLLKDFLRLRCSFGSSRRQELSFSQELKVVAQLSDKLWLHILPKLPK